MGQYYRVLTKNKENLYTAYNRNIIENGVERYMMAKLMEHSWWLNPFVNAIAEKLHNNPLNVVWLGDYSSNFMDYYPQGFNGLNKEQVERLDMMAWGKHSRTIAINSSDFTLDGKYLVNHTKQEYIDCSLYFKNSVMKTTDDDDGWCVHPLSLLTCIGNGCGGGDYNSPSADSTDELVGTWAFNEISVEDTAPNNFIEIEPIFKEQGWED